MFKKITENFLQLSAEAAFKAAVCSVGIPSRSGMCQPKEPEALQAIAKEYQKSHQKM